MTGFQARASAMADAQRRLVEDEAIYDLIRDTVQKLNELGDRLEAFVSDGEPSTENEEREP